MTLHKIGYEVVYRDGAFKTPSGPDGTRRWNPVPERLLDTLELGRKIALEKSDGDWVIVIKRHLERFQTDDLMAELVIYVPAGADQKTALFEALTSFEEVLSERLGIPVDTGYRRIEGHSLLCAMCGEKPTWRYPSSDGIDDYFCDLHVRMDPRFAKFGLIRAEEMPITI